ncbi:hypothetical protein AV530_015931 [Patagioenas fasciata monilis]|uniref:Uncharacterized protein n=1 Tax=Patagioenas fasciata monilis TaxID=372326 RepID=A0A1V4KL77_PATFA|nr:hypothetical protein AV530_015931 [Patagioenas fasciata monilis]
MELLLRNGSGVLTACCLGVQNPAVTRSFFPSVGFKFPGVLNSSGLILELLRPQLKRQEMSYSSSLATSGEENQPDTLRACILQLET